MNAHVLGNCPFVRIRGLALEPDIDRSGNSRVVEIDTNGDIERLNIECQPWLA